MKRKRDEDIILPDAPTGTPRKSRLKDPLNTPSKSLAGTPRKVKFLAEEAASEAKTRSPRTPRNKRIADDEDATLHDPPIVRNANRSARRKSVRSIIQQTIREDLDDDADAYDDEDEDLAQRIYDDEDGADSEDSASEGDVDVDATPKASATASTTRKKKRGRRKKEKEKSPPTVPIASEGFNGYFEQNRVRARASTTTNTLPTLDPKTYFEVLEKYEDRHKDDIEHLSSLHAKNFGQWSFELSEGFNVLLYGYGSKRKLLMEFVKREAGLGHEIVIVNGYVAGLTLRDVFNTVITATLGQEHGRKLGSSANEMLENTLHILDEEREKPLTVVIHSVDASALRTAQIQSLLAQLAAHPMIRLIASSDNIYAPLLWDSSTLTLYNFIFHDATTFVPYDLELSAADESESIINILTGGGANRAGRSGARGVKYVLASLTGNAKNLYRTLIATQLQAMEEDGANKEKMSGEAYGVEYRSLYQIALSEFICSNDVVFRTLLKEFYDHQMITSRKDLQGSELLWAPFRKEELESILEDLVLG